MDGTTHRPPQLIVELIRRPDLDGWHTISYKLTVDGSPEETLKALHTAAAEMEARYNQSTKGDKDGYKQSSFVSG